MKIIITLSQLKKILKSEHLKYPITFIEENFTEKEFSVFQRLLQSEERG
jgi:enolase